MSFLIGLLANGSWRLAEKMLKANHQSLTANKKTAGKSKGVGTLSRLWGRATPSFTLLAKDDAVKISAV